MVGLLIEFRAKVGGNGSVNTASTSSSEIQPKFVTVILLKVPADNPEIVPTFPTTTIVTV